MTDDRRQYVWKHNAKFGYVKMARVNMQAILNSDSSTTEAKTIAFDIIVQLDKLTEALRTRVDHDA